MEKPRLLDQVRQTIRMKHYSIRTEKAYIEWVKNFILFHNKRHPLEMGKQEIRQYLKHLALHKNVSSSTQNQALCAILFLYREVLMKELDYVDDIDWATKTLKPPLFIHIF